MLCPVTQGAPGRQPVQACARTSRASNLSPGALQAGTGLVVLEAESQEVCQTGFEEEAELQWKEDKDAALAPCGEIKHVFARTARDCPEVTFLALEVGAAGPPPFPVIYFTPGWAISRCNAMSAVSPTHLQEGISLI